MKTFILLTLHLLLLGVDSTSDGLIYNLFMVLINGLQLLKLMYPNFNKTCIRLSLSGQRKLR